MTTENNNTAAELLQQGLQQLQLQFTSQQVQQFITYLNLLNKWNKHINLTAIDSFAEMVRLHILDSLSLLHFIDGDNIADVGSGGGLPGIPLAIMLPQKKFTLIESRQKRASFLQRTVADLNLKNITVVASRVESFHPNKKFDVVTSRAFSALSQFFDLTQHLLSANGKLVAMKGKNPQLEIEALPVTCKVLQIAKVVVPMVAQQRHVVVLQK